MLGALASMAPQDCIYTVTIVQQPVRARMCGFGDKDRRPISPPLVVQLRAVDRNTGRELPVDDIDTTFLILAADLRSGNDAQADANRLQQSREAGRTPCDTASVSPSGSSQHGSRSASPKSPPSTTVSPASSAASPNSLYTAPVNEAGTPSGLTMAASPPPAYNSAVLPPSSHNGTPPTLPKRSLSPRDPPASLDMPPPAAYGAEPPAKKRARSTSSGSANAITAPTASTFISYASPSHASVELSTPPPAPASSAAPPSAAMGMCEPEGELDDGPGPIPNLIGTLHTNAHKLKGLDGNRGVYFVMPDLSVRTEGAFKIRVRLLRIGLGASRAEQRLPVVAHSLSDEFRVYSAKKFEGMLDPTPLSQCFARQGMRIPTRKVARARASKGAAPSADKEEVKEEV